MGACCTLCGALAGLGPIAAASAKEGRPNVLWIVLDDVGPDLGCYGRTEISTPNLDRLAEQGVLFENAFASAPVCTPSRSAFFTGMYQTTIGAQDHSSQIGTLPDGVESITTSLKRAGYFNVNIVAEGDFKEKKIYGSSGKTHWNFRPRQEPFDLEHRWDVARPEQIFAGGGWEKRKPSQPFFAYVNIETAKAHGFGEGRKWALERGLSLDQSQVKIPPYYPDTPQMRNRLGMYYDAVMHMDHVVGKVLDSLARAGFDENTLVFFFADHGRAMMRHKQWLYDGGLHVPLIVRWPGRLPAGSVRSDMVSLIDVAPSTLMAAGLEVPAAMEAKPMFASQEKREYIFAARDRCDNTVDKVRCVRTQYFKYIRNFYPERPYTQESSYAMGAFHALRILTQMKADGQTLTAEQELFMADHKPPEELYDIRSDSYEVDNLIEDVEYSEILEEMRGLMAPHLAEK
jgi:N-sulfoglucosamine sulfohydrolase